MTAPRDETPPREQAIRDREQRATLGPWRYAPTDMRQNHRLVGPTGEGIATFWNSSVGTDAPPNIEGHRPRNAAFIAHAREDIPWLLEQLSGLRASLARAEAALQQIEWAGGATIDFGTCPDCYATETEGHAPTCLIGQALRAASPDGERA